MQLKGTKGIGEERADRKGRTKERERGRHTQHTNCCICVVYFDKTLCSAFSWDCSKSAWFFSSSEWASVSALCWFTSVSNCDCKRYVKAGVWVLIKWKIITSTKMCCSHTLKNTQWNETKRKETKRNETKLNKTKGNETTKITALPVSLLTLVWGLHFLCVSLAESSYCL